MNSKTNEHIIQQLENELFELRNSLSYKIGLFISYPARKIYDFLEAYFPILSSNRKEKLYHKRIVNRYQQRNPNVIFTFILNNHDYLKEPSIISPGWDYLCFTDNFALKSNVWQIVHLNELDFIDFPQSTKKRSMLIMILYYKFISKKYDIVISIGGQIKINCNLNDIIEETINSKKIDLSICRHPLRDCVYEEAEACKFYNKDSFNVIDMQMQRYRNDNYPEHAKLYSTGIMIRKNRSLRLKKVCILWSKELIEGSQRDQLSLNYSIWKTKFKLRIKELERSKYLDRDETLPFVLYDHISK